MHIFPRETKYAVRPTLGTSSPGRKAAVFELMFYDPAQLRQNGSDIGQIIYKSSTDH